MAFVDDFEGYSTPEADAPLVVARNSLRTNEYWWSTDKDGVDWRIDASVLKTRLEEWSDASKRPRNIHKQTVELLLDFTDNLLLDESPEPIHNLQLE